MNYPVVSSIYDHRQDWNAILVDRAYIIHLPVSWARRGSRSSLSRCRASASSGSPPNIMCQPVAMTGSTYLLTQRTITVPTCGESQGPWREYIRRLGVQVGLRFIVDQIPARSFVNPLSSGRHGVRLRAYGSGHRVYKIGFDGWPSMPISHNITQWGMQYWRHDRWANHSVCTLLIYQSSYPRSSTWHFLNGFSCNTFIYKAQLRGFRDSGIECTSIDTSPAKVSLYLSGVSKYEGPGRINLTCWAAKNAWKEGGERWFSPPCSGQPTASTTRRCPKGCHQKRIQTLQLLTVNLQCSDTGQWCQVPAHDVSPTSANVIVL